MHLKMDVAWGALVFVLLTLTAATAFAENAEATCSPTSCVVQPLQAGPLKINLTATAQADASAPISSAKVIQEPTDGGRSEVTCVAPSALVEGKATIICQVVAQSSGKVTVLVERVAGTSLISKQTTIKATERVGGGSGSEEGANEQRAPALDRLPPELWRRTISGLGLSPQAGRLGQYYNRRDDVAVLFFNSDGEPLGPIPNTIDENDDIYVVVADTNANLAKTEIALAGCNRPPVAPRVFGSTKELPVETAADREADGLGTRHRIFGKCAGADSGGPTVTIQRDGVTKSTTIPVNPLYRFAVGAALAYDATQTREFALRTPPGSSVTRIAESDDRIGLSALIYVSLYVLPRDLRKDQFLLWERVQLFAGLDPRAFDKHLILGLGYELAPGFSLLGGWRVATKQPVLAEGSGLKVGSSFDGTMRNLPTRERWEFGSGFIGVGMNNDLLSRLR